MKRRQISCCSRTDDQRRVRAPLELSRDFDWIRARLSLLYGSGDSNPFDQARHRVRRHLRKTRNSPAPTPATGSARRYRWWAAAAWRCRGPTACSTDLRSSKDEGQSNFTNPGIILAGVGADLDLLPQLRLRLNFNDLSFADTQ